jgi:hypothetical protein
MTSASAADIRLSTSDSTTKLLVGFDAAIGSSTTWHPSKPTRTPRREKRREKKRRAK